MRAHRRKTEFKDTHKYHFRRKGTIGYKPLVLQWTANL